MNFTEFDWLARVLATCAVIVAIVSIIGYAINEPVMYVWAGNGLGMTINISVCVILLAIAIILVSMRRPR